MTSTDTEETNKISVDQPQTHPLPPVDATNEPLPTEVVLEVGHSGKRTRISLKPEQPRSTIGRADKENLVEIDASPFGAFENGVSRQHAVIIWEHDGVYVEDLGSTNGTRINGFVLNPHKAYRLRNNDEVEFGRLRTSVRFVR